MVEKGIAVCQSHGFVLRDAGGGVEVSRILPHGPVDLQKGDGLIAVDGHNVTTSEDAMRRLEGSIGSATETELEVSRGEGRVQEIMKITMPCPQEKAAEGSVVAEEKPAFSFYRKDRQESKTDKPDGPSTPSPSPPAPAAPEVSPAPEPSEAEKEKALGNQAFKDSLWDDAVKHFTAAIDLAPQPVPNTYYSNRAAAYLQAGKAKEALVDAVKSTEGHPDFAKGHYRAGQALLELGRHHEAVAALNRARMCDPNNVQIYGALSRAQAALAAAKNAQEEKYEEEREEARRRQQPAAKCDAPSAPGIKDATQALDATKAASSETGSRAARRNAQPAQDVGAGPGGAGAGLKGWGSGERKKASSAASSAKAGSLWGGEGGVAGSGGADEEAEKAKEEGNKAFSKGEFALAAENFTLAINLDPNNHVYYANRSAALLKMGKLEDALDDADGAIRLNPLYAKGHYRKGQVMALLFYSTLDPKR
jgi:tetratricopeptide (TPR) repeat protein